MTTPREEQPQAQPADEPTVSTAPPGRRRHSIPSHVGPARSSTVILAVLWLALGALYLNVRPPTPATATTGGGSSVEAPAGSTTAPSSTRAPSTTSAPTSTPPSETTTPSEPLSTPPAESTSVEPSTAPSSSVLPPASTGPPTS